MLVEHTQRLNDHKAFCHIPFSPVADLHLFLLYVSPACFIVNLITDLNLLKGQYLNETFG